MADDTIRARYVAAIGETNTVKLAVAGLLPTATEERWSQDVDTGTAGSRRRVEWQKQTRLTTGWKDA